MFHAKRFAFFGTVLVCTVLLTACPRVGVNPIAPGYLLMGLPGDVFEPCDTSFLLKLFADDVLVYNNQAEDESLLKKPAGLGATYYLIPGQMKAGALLRIDIECYGQGQELIEAYKYQDTIQYPVFRRSGAYFLAGPRFVNSDDHPPVDCLIADTDDSQDETQLCVRTNLFSEN